MTGCYAKGNDVNWKSIAVLITLVCGVSGHALGAAADKKEAEKAREKPLQRCDELADKAQFDCLQKARERIVEARQKREASAKSGNKVAPVKEEPRQ